VRKTTQKPRVLVTAGPTRAYLDKVRYLSNYSSGALGYEICRALEKAGYSVMAVVGPCEAPYEKLKTTRVVRVETVTEMHRAVMTLCTTQRPDFAVLAAAVLDFVPAKVEAGKVSSKRAWDLKLVPTPKIIDEMTEKFPHIKKIAFKLEWEPMSLKKLQQFAVKNMVDKHAQALCLNFLSQIKGQKHPAYLINREGDFKTARTKPEIARWICKQVKI
jgi:phosphopantothenoylcysteine synthetase/decarboxylase